MIATRQLARKWMFVNPAVPVAFALLVSINCSESPRADDLSPNWTLASEPRISIGTTVGDERYELENVVDLLILRTGHIVVAEGRQGRLRVYDAQGEHVADWGGDGEGPGEFRGLRSIWLYRGDSIAAEDTELNRISVLGPSGRFTRSLKLPGISEFGHAALPGLAVCCSLSGVFPDGSFLITGAETLPAENGTPIWSSRLLFRLAADGQGFDTIGSFRSRPFARARNGPLGLEPYGFAPNLHVTVINGQIVGGNGEKPEISVWSANAALGRTYRLRSKQEPITDALRTEFERNVRSAGESTIFHFLETQPAFTGLLTDTRSRLWLLQFRYPVAFTDELQHAVLDSAGVEIAQAHIPASYRILWIDDHEIFALVRDSMGVQYVRAYHIERPPDRIGARSGQPSLRKNGSSDGV